jgi:hypothetical protein
MSDEKGFFNFFEGNPISIIRGGNLNNEIVYLDTNDEDENEDNVRDVEISDEGKMELLPSQKKGERHFIVVAGKSGSGKSQWTRTYIKNFLRLFPKRPVYIFSPVMEDIAYDDLKINRVILDESLLDDPINVEDLENSLCIFDDHDQIREPAIKTEIKRLIENIGQIGRHRNISACILIHKVANFKDTRDILNEASHTVLFLRGYKGGINKYYLTKYQELDKKEIERVYKLPSRWVCFQCNYPSFIMYEKGVYVPS